jgi:hypothetical protein
MHGHNSYIFPYTLGFAVITAAAVISLTAVDTSLVPSRNYHLTKISSDPDQWESQHQNTVVSWSFTDSGLLSKLDIIHNFATDLLNESKDLRPEIVQMVNDNFWDLLA